MASNHKLTSLIKGRTITGTQNQGGILAVTFNDGSIMTVKTAGTENSAATGETIKAVRQQDTRLSLDFENGSTSDIVTAEPTSSVIVRAKDHTLEYAD